MCLKLCRWACIGILVVVVMLPATILAKRESHEFTLSTGKGLVDSYTREYEITLEREGLIRVNLRVATADRKMNPPLLLGISNKLQNKIRTTALYHSNEKGADLRHAADSQPLKNGRTYIVYVESNSTSQNATGTLTIASPAGPEEPQPANVPAVSMGQPDLLVHSVRLTKDCRVLVTLINKGPGQLPDSAWAQKTSPTLMLYRNGKSWNSANLSVIDPQQRLKDVNGRARYLSNLKVGGQTNIQAVIDYQGLLAEADKNNNAKVEVLQCK